FAGLVFYIGLGMIAFRFGRTPGIKVAAFLGAVLSFAYIVGAAVQKSPISWLG
ncbi:MAG: regulator SirB, partial [Woeseiaceae bacterium]|nr:regulator SirB [Woeseiaceae bacterium]NIP20965.1 regulator SirB [Woeseiaceae bacterium]